MLHLTLTGFYAGKPLCDVDKAAAIERGERFAHAAYTNLELPDICRDCKQAWDSVSDDDSDN
jgi:hypothetical protein